MYSEAEQKGFAGYELFVMAVGHGLQKANIYVDMHDHDTGPWSMTIEEACRGCIMAAMAGDAKRAECYLAPVIRRLAPASHDMIESIRKLSEHYKKEKAENEIICDNRDGGTSDWVRCCA